MKVLIHLDPVVLERELVARLERGRDADPLRRTLILVPTTRLADHVQRRLLERRRAWVGIEVLNARSVAWRILETVPGNAALRLASGRLLEELVRRGLAEQPDNFWSQWIVRRPGTLRRLAGSFQELREAGVTAKQLAASSGDQPRARALAELFGDYEARLAQRAKGGWVDEAGLLRAVLPHAQGHASQWTEIYLHGAYEWTGIHLELIRQLARQVTTLALVPACTTGRIAEYSRDFARRFLLPARGKLVPLDDPLPIEQRAHLEALYDEPARPRPAAASRFSFRHAQGEPGEVQVAVREALASIRDGCPATEIAIVARSLAPYAAALEQALDDAKIPWTSSLGSPLRRHPLVRDFLRLLEIVAHDFPRAATSELLRSPRVRWDTLLGEGRRSPGERADVWSRQARLLGGIQEWTEDFELWAGEAFRLRNEGDHVRRERRVAQVRNIGNALRLLRKRFDPRPRSWSEHAARLRTQLEQLLQHPEENESATVLALDALGGLLDEMERLESFVGDSKPVDFRQMHSWLVTAVDGSEIRLRQEDRGGLRVLDAMQARGLTFRRVHLLGVNAGLFPRAAREDPLLGDPLRERLRSRSGRPLPLKGHRDDEERLLLALTLGAAYEGVEISWQRSDEAGRAKTPSLALREIARVARGAPDVSLVKSKQLVQHLPSHPRQWIERLLQQTGLVSPAEALVLAALDAGDTGDLSDLGQLHPVLSPGARMLQATQAFEWVDPAFDARVGPQADRAISVSAFQNLGGCPLRFFFQNVLGVRELDEQARPFTIEPRELGSAVHGVLERVYRTLADEGRFDGPAAAAAERAVELLRHERENLLGPLGARLARRTPVLVQRTLDDWAANLELFVHNDVSKLIDQQRRPLGFELDVKKTVELGEQVTLELYGRFDRHFQEGTRSIVGDYKTSGKLDQQTNPLNLLRGRHLQPALYRLLLDRGDDVELVGVGPRFDPDERVRFQLEIPDERVEQGIRETLRVLLELRNQGRFPLLPGLHCNWCPYQQACRRNHPPTQVREQELAGDTLDFRSLKDKSRKQPLLDQRERGA